MPANVDTMVYNRKNGLPWHGLGVALDGCRSTDEVIRALQAEPGNKLCREVRRVPVALLDSGAECEGFWAIRRDGETQPYHIAGPQYRPLQDSDLLAFADALTEQGAAWETVGTLRNGAHVFGLASVPGSGYKVAEGDPVTPYLLYWNTHDGSSAIRVRFTSVRVVCSNTAAIALAGSAREYATRHTTGAQDRLREAAAEALGLASAAFREHERVARELASEAFSRDAMRTLACQLLTREDDAAKAVRVVADSEGRSRSLYKKRGGELLHLFESGAGNSGETRWHALNAVTEYVDHARARLNGWRSLDRRARGFDSAQWGDGEQMKRRALRLLHTRDGRTVTGR